MLQDAERLAVYLWLYKFHAKCSEQKSFPINGIEYVPYIEQGNVWQGEMLFKWEGHCYFLQSVVAISYDNSEQPIGPTLMGR
jgi:hypothetical protein